MPGLQLLFIAGRALSYDLEFVLRGAMSAFCRCKKEFCTVLADLTWLFLAGYFLKFMARDREAVRAMTFHEHGISDRDGLQIHEYEEC